MNVNFTDAELINNLPTSDTVPNNNEVQILNTLFKQTQKPFEQFMSKGKDTILVGLLFVLFSIPYTDEVVQKFFPSSTTSLYTKILIKTALMMIAYFVIKNIHLVKK